jgi:TRAP-type C4-dicarboxylate transport system substrate-binding protein
VWSRTWSILGAQNLSMGWPDIYLALERGTLDAGTTSWAASVGWKWQEVAESPIDISVMGGFFCGIAMNNEAWASLTPETQARWAKLADDYALRFSKAYDDGDVDAKAIWKEAGRTITEFPAEEKKRLAQALLPIWQDWVAENEAAGRPAKRMYQVYVETMKKLGEPVVMQLPGLY